MPQAAEEAERFATAGVGGPGCRQQQQKQEDHPERDAETRRHEERQEDLEFFKIAETLLFIRNNQSLTKGLCSWRSVI
jgi:hypothetical protein